MNRRKRAPYVLALVWAICVSLIILSGCKPVERVEKTVDLTDYRNAIQDDKPDTTYLDAPNTLPLFFPGATSTAPETVKVYRDRAPMGDSTTYPDSSRTALVEHVRADSALVVVRMTGAEYSFNAPCFGQTLTINFSSGDPVANVTGQCTPRDTTVVFEREKPSWIDRQLQRLGTFAFLLIIIGSLALVLAGGYRIGRGFI